MIHRFLEPRLKRAARKYPVVALIGPRQSGKTTLAKLAFPKLQYVSLENPDIREFAAADPNRFLAQFPSGAVLDEIQRLPDLFSYIQTLVDKRNKAGLFVLTGSQNFGIMENISQSLAGRVSIQKLMPLSAGELRLAQRLPKTMEETLFMGGYPRIFEKRIPPTEWMKDYVATYLERDVRNLKRIGDLSSFHRFLRMTAGRSGQLLNLSSLASDCGITHNTAKAWLSILEASFIIHLLPPHHKNFDKRLKKSPKLYFYDTGLLCFLLGLTKAKDVANHSMRGAIFENFVIGEFLKRIFNEGLSPELYFWQDKTGKEVDCLIEKSNRLVPVEIKSGQTIAADYFDGLKYWERLSRAKPGKGYVIYGGKLDQTRREARVLGWSQLDQIPL